MIKYLNDRGVVRLTGTITQESVTRLIESMEHLRRDCFYDRITIEIASTGGDIGAYERLVEFIEGLTADGVRIDTDASGITASAAAFLLSSGEERRASPGCRLRYHLCRVPGGKDLTAAGAGSAAVALDDLDASIVEKLAERGVRAAKRRRKRAEPDDFQSCDWEAIAQLLLVLSKGKAAGLTGKPETLDALRLVLNEHGSDADTLATLYRTLFALDCPISPVLAREMFLIDRIGLATSAKRKGAGRGIAVPEWKAIWPGGVVATRYLRRHTLILGETGSGKTVSGVMPLLRSMLKPDSGLGCALVIDPKRELLTAVEDLSENVRVIEPSRPGKPASVLNLTSAPEWGLDAHMRSKRYQDAARQILLRSATLPARSCCAPRRWPTGRRRGSGRACPRGMCTTPTGSTKAAASRHSRSRSRSPSSTGAMRSLQGWSRVHRSSRCRIGPGMHSTSLRRPPGSCFAGANSLPLSTGRSGK